MRLAEIEQELDETTGTGPKKKTPEEMMQNPLELLDPEESQTIDEQQKRLDDTWQVAEGNNIRPAKKHDYSINDNDSKNGPVK